MSNNKTKNLLDKIKMSATYPQTPVSIKQMVEFGQTPSPITLLKASQFMHRELPVRLAHRVVELENLPLNLSKMPSVQKVKEWYTTSYQDLHEFPRFKTTDPQQISQYYQTDSDMPVTLEMMDYIRNISKTIEIIKRRHDPTQLTIAQGILELKESWKASNNPLYTPSGRVSLPLPTTIQSFLDRFYLSRIGIRMLIGQHIGLVKAHFNPSSIHPDYVGIICTKTNIGAIAQDAIDNARYICQEYYGLYEAPQVRIMGNTDISFMYVPSHLHHMLFELLKNSLRAVVERFGSECDEYPEIRLIIAEGKEDITIKIADEGGGIARSGIPLIWSYMYTTAENPLLQNGSEGRMDQRIPLAGYGYGLPLSRLYARYFGGDLRLISMEGFGTDAYMHLSRLSDSDEPLT